MRPSVCGNWENGRGNRPRFPITRGQASLRRPTILRPSETSREGYVGGMHGFMEEQGYVLDITDQRMHHEIYLSDARKVAPERLKTVVRHPIRRA